MEAGKKHFVGFELPGRTLGVIGLGAIGVKVANAARALGMKVVGYDPTITVAARLAVGERCAAGAQHRRPAVALRLRDLPCAAHRRDPPHDQRRALARSCKKGAVLLNFSREGILDDEAVVAALDQGHLYAYCCDFPSNLLKDHPRVVTLPHLGASTAEAEDNCAIMVADQVRDYLEDGNVANSVNFPEINLPRNGGYRLAIVNSNVPNMVGQISTDLAAAGLNILDMLNRSRGDVAVTLIDVDKRCPEATVAQLRAIEGVLSVRCLGD